jgi:predicted ATP-dependent protease
MPEDLDPAKAHRVAAEALRWRCDEDWVAEFDSTETIEPIAGVIGQDGAIDSLRFGLEIHAPGQNIFVRGISGTGRLTLLRGLLREVRLACPLAPDLCYVHDFSSPHEPRLLQLPRGKARRFATRVDDLIEFITAELLPLLSSEVMREKRAALDARAAEERTALTDPFEADLAERDLMLVPIEDEGSVRMAILPVVDGKVYRHEAYEAMIASGEVSAEAAEATTRAMQEEAGRFQAIGRQMEELREAHRQRVRALFEGEARRQVEGFIRPILVEHAQDAPRQFLEAVVEDLLGQRLGPLVREEDTSFTRLYQVNVVSDHSDPDDCPVIVESHPTLSNLFGGLDPEFVPGGGMQLDHASVRVGSVVHADGGYLLVEARDLITEPGAWPALKRFLRTGEAVIPTEGPDGRSIGPGLEPEAPRANVKVVLIGDPGLYTILDQVDPEFSLLFKVLADFDTTIPRSAESVASYAGVLSRIAREEGLTPFDGTAIAALAEHGARIAGRNDRLTTRFGRLADIAREASFNAAKDPKPRVGRRHIEEAVASTKRRADLPARRFREQIAEGAVRIATTGRVVGQVNGLAVVNAGPLTYGFPSRITATIGPGTAGAINIEGEAELSGSIHTKGFYILGGLLRHLLPTDHPLAFSASIAFEQSYGGIDGDSASGAEVCCLISALTGVPLRQDRAMTGAIDQHGHVQPIGAVNEKIEGFFDVCEATGLTGEQGVIVPRSNVRNLMLRPSVVDACRRGEFHVFAVDTITEALEVFTDRAAGSLDESGAYAPETILGRAVARAGEFWSAVREGAGRR